MNTVGSTYFSFKFKLAALIATANAKVTGAGAPAEGTKSGTLLASG